MNDDDSIDESQLKEYQEEVEALGDFPDKVIINTLSMIAEDFDSSESSTTKIYEIIKTRLLHGNSNYMLPVIYLLDSILKNVKGHYIKYVEQDAAEWMPKIHDKANGLQQQKLQKVWKTWNEFNLFSEKSWKAMGRCFNDDASLGISLFEPVAGISRTKDGSLILSSNLRKEMMNILEDLQNDKPESEKVSLERLADINPDLLANIKSAATDSLSLGTSVKSKDENTLPSFFAESRSTEAIEATKQWQSVSVDVNSVLSSLRGLKTDEGHTQHEAIQLTQYLGAVTATIQLLETTNTKDDTDATSFQPIRDAKNLTKQQIVGSLYSLGLPFMSSADGRRFKSQLELSKHLDRLFQTNRLEKSIATAAERGWYVSEKVWTLEQTREEANQDVSSPAVTAQGVNLKQELEESTFPADETRDKCVVCGLPFQMIFDDGYQYRNCREITVLNDDDVAIHDQEEQLLHVTCWKGLGSPETLTSDQTLQDDMDMYRDL